MTWPRPGHSSKRACIESFPLRFASVPTPKKDDLDALDESWDEPRTPTPTPTPDVEALDDGWGSVESARRHKTGAERAVARKTKALERAERRRGKAAAAAQKQKAKLKRAKPVESDEPRPAKRARKKNHDAPSPASATAIATAAADSRSWRRMLLAVAVIVAVAAFVLFVLAR